MDPRPVVTAVEAAAELLTVRDWVRHACTRLQASGAAFGQGTDNAFDEAMWLVLWALRLPLEHPEPFLDARLARSERECLAALIERRCDERLPTAYLTGEAWLRGLRFVADRRALVPRSLIVEALQDVLDDWLGDEPPGSVLDLCCGGGSIAIHAALHFPDAHVDAADLSSDALELARENLALHGLGGRIRLLQGDLFAAVGRRRYDLILCNPPYVNAQSMHALPPEFLAEPRAALAGGDDGMDLVRRIVADAPAHLAPGGRLLLEIGHEAPHFEAAFPGLECAWLPVAAGDDQLVLVTREQLVAAHRA
jgi:ribosomal protein L3 glutamine methyltransferase